MLLVTEDADTKCPDTSEFTDTKTINIAQLVKKVKQRTLPKL